MLSRRLPQFARLALLIFLTACIPDSLPQEDPDLNLLYQVSTLSALSAGDFDGNVNMGMLLARGDFGLGTFDALDGEMVVLDGQVYQVRDDGIAYLADDLETPFAAVTFFATDQSLVARAAGVCADFQAEIDSQLPTLDAPYAIKVSGVYSYLKVRAPHKQSEPYPTLADALATQVVFESQNVSGTMVGFRLPDYLAGANVPGYHFHFISDDKQHGGHVLDCQAETVLVEIDTIDRIFIDVTPDYLAPQQETIKYGLLLPFSGQYRWLGKSAIGAIHMVETDVNISGGINGVRIQIVEGDTQGAVEQGAAAAQTLIDEGVVALIGPTSLAIEGVIPLVVEHQIPMISPSAGTVALDQAGSDYFYRTVPSDSLDGRALAMAAAQSTGYLGEAFAKVVLMVTDSPAFLSFQAPIQNGFRDAGTELVSAVVLPPEAVSYSDPVQSVLAQSPDLIILIADPEDAVKVMEETIAVGYTGRWFFTQDQTTPEYIQLAGAEAVEGSYGLFEIAAPASPAQLAIFTDQYTQINGQSPEPFASNTYDAATVLALAMLRASIHDWEVTRASINANLPLVANPGDGKRVVTSYLEGKEVLMAGSEINYHGVSGPIDFDEYGNVVQPYGIFQVQDGAWVQISTISSDMLQALVEEQ